MRAGAEDLEAISGQMTQQAFGHLAASGISGTENQNAFLHLKFQAKNKRSFDFAYSHMRREYIPVRMTRVQGDDSLTGLRSICAGNRALR